MRWTGFRKSRRLTWTEKWEAISGMQTQCGRCLWIWGALHRMGTNVLLGAGQALGKSLGSDSKSQGSCREGLCVLGEGVLESGKVTQPQSRAACCLRLGSGLCGSAVTARCSLCSAHVAGLFLPPHAPRRAPSLLSPQPPPARCPSVSRLLLPSPVSTFSFLLNHENSVPSLGLDLPLW